MGWEGVLGLPGPSPRRRPRLRESGTQGPASAGPAAGNGGSRLGTGILRKSGPGIPTGEGVAHSRGSAVEREGLGVLGERAAPAQDDPTEEGGVKRRTASGSRSRPGRTAGGGLREGVTGGRSESPPSSRPDAGTDRWSPRRRLHPGRRQPLSPLGVGVAELCLGCRAGIRAGRRERGRARSPAPVPRSDPRGEGVISARRRGSRGGSSEEGAAARPPPPARSVGGEADPPWSLSSPLTNSFRILWPRIRGTDPTGPGATRGRSHPASALGEGAARRAFRSRGDAAASGTRGPRAPGTPGGEFPAAAGAAERGSGPLRSPPDREAGSEPPAVPAAPGAERKPGFCGRDRWSRRGHACGAGRWGRGSVSLPGPRPHCLSRLRPRPTPQHVLAAPRWMPWGFFWLFFVCRASELTPTCAHRASARRFYPFQSRDLQTRRTSVPPPGFALKINGARRGGGEGFRLGFSVSTTFKTHRPNSRFVLASHVFVPYLSLLCFFFLFFPWGNKLKYYQLLVAEWEKDFYPRSWATCVSHSPPLLPPSPLFLTI